MQWQEPEETHTDYLTDIETLPEMLEESVTRHGELPAQSYKGGIHDRSLAGTAFDAAADGEYATLTYAEMGEIIRFLATGFRSIGIEPGDTVAICADTRVEWALCDFALQAAGAIVTTIYTSSSPEQIRHLVSDPDDDYVIVGNNELFKKIAEACDTFDMDTYIGMNSSIESASAANADVVSLETLYTTGKTSFDQTEYEQWLANNEAEDIASIVYTSGTTGEPKGAEITHENFCANLKQLRKRIATRPDKDAELPAIESGMASLSFLPLAHIFERLAGHFLPYVSGVCVNYAESDKTLKSDLAATQPEIFTSVPRVYEKLYNSIQSQASGPVKSRIFDWATDVAREHQQTDSPGRVLEAKYSLADSLVFADVREGLGGNMEMIISGGGTISAELCRLYHGMDLNILEGYGLTETSPVVAVNPIENIQIGTIGAPLTGVDVSIDESIVDSSVFDCEGDVGELLVKGDNVFEGYWELPEKTDEAFTDGWFRTGDIVHQRPDGYLEFKERRKQLLVLSTGKNVAPAPIESSFATSEFVEQCMVVGDGEKLVSALIVPKFDEVEEWAAENNIELPDSRGAVCEHSEVRKRIQREINWVNLNFENHETIKEFYLIPDAFTEENGLLTPSQKKKRPDIVREYGHLWQSN